MFMQVTTCEPCAHALQFSYYASPCTIATDHRKPYGHNPNKDAPIFQLKDWNTICLGKDGE